MMETGTDAEFFPTIQTADEMTCLRGRAVIRGKHAFIRARHILEFDSGVTVMIVIPLAVFKLIITLHDENAHFGEIIQRETQFRGMIRVGFEAESLIQQDFAEEIFDRDTDFSGGIRAGGDDPQFTFDRIPSRHEIAGIRGQEASFHGMRPEGGRPVPFFPLQRIHPRAGGRVLFRSGTELHRHYRVFRRDAEREGIAFPLRSQFISMAAAFPRSSFAAFAHVEIESPDREFGLFPGFAPGVKAERVSSRVVDGMKQGDVRIAPERIPVVTGIEFQRVFSMPGNGTVNFERSPIP